MKFTDVSVVFDTSWLLALTNSSWSEASLQLFYNFIENDSAQSREMVSVRVGSKTALVKQLSNLKIFGQYYFPQQLPAICWLDVSFPVLQWDIIDTEQNSFRIILPHNDLLAANKVKMNLQASLVDQVDELLQDQQQHNKQKQWSDLMDFKHMAIKMMQAFSGSDVAATPVCKV